MDNLESIIQNLCKRAESLISTISKIKNRQKWIRINGSVTLKEFPQIESALQIAFIDESFTSSDEYQAIEQFLKTDSVFSTSTERGGYHGLPNRLINRILLKAMTLNNGNITFDPKFAKNELNYFKSCFHSKEVLYKARARIFGVELPIPRINITDNIYLVKLTDVEMNERQEFIDISNLEDNDSKSLFEYTEIRMIFKIPINENIESPVLSTGNESSKKSRKAFNDVIAALRLIKSGNIELGAIHISSFISSFATDNIYKLYISLSKIKINDSDIDSLLRAYRIVTEFQRSDKILERALNRFLLGKQRHDPVDRLIDYVIAWESILLTVNGNAIMNETSYRFGINGSSLLYASDAEKDRISGLKLMKEIYSIRSKIVHGASKEDINKEINKAEFNNLTDLVSDIEEKFRKVTFWLSDLKRDDRPYFKLGGWEQYLWEK